MVASLEPFTEKEAANIIVTCIEGGSNYWLEDYKIKVSKRIKDDTLDMISEFNLEIRKGYEDEAEPVAHPLVNAETLWAAAQRIFNENLVRKDIKTDIFGERDGCDADGADSLLQVCVFGTLVYG